MKEYIEGLNELAEELEKTTPVTSYLTAAAADLRSASANLLNHSELPAVKAARKAVKVEQQQQQQQTLKPEPPVKKDDAPLTPPESPAQKPATPVSASSAKKTEPPK